ncbi:MAG: low molecular weight phosphotyrosine protein phosphatase [Zetaproteobacteria bacterium]|nr:low molecular weight phosphotyrosine protein phosphatase [Zetaproteobacteria bacterium]
MSKPTLRILFVCLGNICRSPLAEIIAKHIANERNISQLFHFESAGTGDWHIGAQADPRSIAIAQQHGLDLKKHCAQQVTTHNVHHWDYLIAMDHENRINLLAMGVPKHKILMMRQFEENIHDINDAQTVSDPYYGGENGFKDAYKVLNHSTTCLLDELLEKHP